MMEEIQEFVKSLLTTIDSYAKEHDFELCKKENASIEVEMGVMKKKDNDGKIRFYIFEGGKKVGSESFQKVKFYLNKKYKPWIA